MAVLIYVTFKVDRTCLQKNLFESFFNVTKRLQSWPKVIGHVSEYVFNFPSGVNMQIIYVYTLIIIRIVCLLQNCTK